MIPTAETFLKNYIGISIDAPELTPMDKGECKKMMIDFAKLHCTEQARVISEKAEMTGIAYGNDESISDYEVDKDSILNAYSLDLIK